MNTITIFCKNIQQYIEVEEFTNSVSLLNDPRMQLNISPIVVLVDNVARDLNYTIHRTCSVEFVDETHPEGFRAYLNSLYFITYKAVHELFPEKTLVIEHAVANGFFMQINDLGQDLKESVEQIKAKMQEIVSQDLPFVFQTHETQRLVEIYESQGLSQKSKLLKRKNALYAECYKMGGLYNYFFGPMARSTGRINIFDLQPYYRGILLIAPNIKKPFQLNERSSLKKVFNVLHEFRQWSEVLGVSDIDDLNKKAVDDEGSQMIKLSEAMHEKKIAEIASEICMHGQYKVILIAGPSSSGKTSFSKRLSIHLEVNKIQGTTLSMDDYFVNRDRTPRDENGDFDFESIEAVDIPQFNQDVRRLSEGEEVEIPRFDFQTGYRAPKGKLTQLANNQVLIIEGIHALNPQLLQDTPPEHICRIYVSALATTSFDSHNRVSTSDVRLVRRLVRDTNYRGMQVHNVFDMWTKVLVGEQLNIFPYQDHADFIFNSALPYELSIMKPYALPIVQRLTSNSEYVYQADRLRKMFGFIKSLPSKEVPPTSILREFIGGSSLKY